MCVCVCMYVWQQLPFQRNPLKKKKEGRKGEALSTSAKVCVCVCVCVLRRVFPEYTHIFEKKGLGIRHYTIKR